MTAHSSAAIQSLRQMAEGRGGNVLLLAAGSAPFYAGARRPFAEHFLEAVLELACHPDYGTIGAITGVGRHLPVLRIDSNASVSLVPAGWTVRTPKAAESSADSAGVDDDGADDDDDDLPSAHRLIRRHGIVTTSRLRFHANGVPWAERMMAMMGMIEEMLGAEWRLDRHMPMANAGRALVVVDESYLLPDRREDLRMLPSQNQREMVAARMHSLLRQISDSQTDLVVLCGNVPRAQALADGRLIAEELDGREEAAHFPHLSIPGTVVAWPSKDAQRPFGEFWQLTAPPGRTTFYDVLRGMPPQPVPSPLEELEGMIGMDGVRQQIESLEASVRASLRRQRLGLPANSLRLHTALYGPPGTGKTTVARILGRVFARLGLLEPGRFVEANREKLVGAYIGHTEQKTAEVCTQALGGVLFIDEAYALTPASPNDFGKQAIDSLLTWMENHKDRLAVIFAGYEDEMKAFIDENPGMHSRIQFHITLRAYTDDELVQITQSMATRGGNLIVPEALPVVRRRLIELRAASVQSGRPFGNGRTAENLLRAACAERDRRLASAAASRDDLIRLLPQDFAGARIV